MKKSNEKDFKEMLNKLVTDIASRVMVRLIVDAIKLVWESLWC